MRSALYYFLIYTKSCVHTGQRLVFRSWEFYFDKLLDLVLTFRSTTSIISKERNEKFVLKIKTKKLERDISFLILLSVSTYIMTYSMLIVLRPNFHQ